MHLTVASHKPVPCKAAWYSSAAACQHGMPYMACSDHHACARLSMHAVWCSQEGWEVASLTINSSEVRAATCHQRGTKSASQEDAAALFSRKSALPGLPVAEATEPATLPHHNWKAPTGDRAYRQSLDVTMASAKGVSNSMSESANQGTSGTASQRPSTSEGGVSGKERGAKKGPFTAQSSKQASISGLPSPFAPLVAGVPLGPTRLRGIQVRGK